VLYATTPGFLERLGLPSLASLPALAPLLEPSTDDEDPVGTALGDDAGPGAPDEVAEAMPDMPSGE
jgi:hypothetical protein